ncbi:MAG: RNA polymerase sigma factor [Pirellula sp.]
MSHSNEDAVEQELTDLIRQFNEAMGADPVDPAVVQSIEVKIFEVIAVYLRMALKPTLARVFGKGVYSSREDSSVRFSAMLNDLFVKILDKEKHVALRLATAKHLRNWCSRVVVNQMIDHVRRKKVESRALSDIAPLYDVRKSAFSTRFGETFDDFLEIIQDWYRHPDEEVRQDAWLLELHYVMGMNWQEVCDVMGLPKTTFYEVRKKALERMKRLLNPSGSSIS